MTDFQKPDLSKDTSGPFVTRDGRAAEFLGSAAGRNEYRYVFRVPGLNDLVTVAFDGTEQGWDDSSLDIFLAPKEPKTVFVNWYSTGEAFAFDSLSEAQEDAARTVGFLATVTQHFDDQGVPVHNSVVRRIEG